MDRTRLPILHSAAFLSGAGALVHEIVWVRRLGEILGQTIWAVNVVLAVFFLGLGVGAWIFGRLADRRGGWIGLFVALEITVAASAILFWPASVLLERGWLALAPAEWPLSRALPVKAAGAGLLLTIPTLAMGGTLPALVRHVVRRSDEFAPRLGGLYGLNTLGAAAGVAAAVLLLVPRLGLLGASAAGAAANTAAALLAHVGRLRASSPTAAIQGAPPSVARVEVLLAPQTASSRILLAAAALSGFLAVGLEVLWTRALASRLLSTVYSFATILFAYLLALALGATVVGLLDRRGLVRRSTAACVLALAGLSGLLSASALATGGLARGIPNRAVEGFEGFARMQVAELWSTALVVTLAMLFFGLNLPLLARLAHRQASAVGGEIGRFWLANTVGSVAAPLVVGFLVLPSMGVRNALLSIGWTALVFALAVLLPWSEVGVRFRALAQAAGGVAGVLLSAAAPDDLRLWATGPDDRLLHYEESAAASIAVVETPDGQRFLSLDHHYRLGDTRTRFAQQRQGLIPLLLAPSPQRTLFIGVGTGSSAGAAVAFGGTAADMIEIVPGLGPLLFWFGAANENLAVELARRGDVRLLEVDGRQFVRATLRRYDVVVGDLFIPWRAGEGAMYTLEHLEAVAEVLAPGGLFCQWIPLYQLGPKELRTIVRTFCRAFPQVEAFWLYFNVEQPAIALVGSTSPLRVDIASLATRMAAPQRARLLAAAGLQAPAELLGSWIAGRDTLAKWAAEAPLETALHPRIEFATPFSLAWGSSTFAAENVALLIQLTHPVQLSSVVAGPPQIVEAATRHQQAIRAFFRGRHAQVYAGARDRALEAYAEALQATPAWSWIHWNLGQLAEEALAAGERRIAEGVVAALEGNASAAELVQRLHALLRAHPPSQNGPASFLR